MERSRIIIKNKYIIITNFKCGFCSLNLLSNISSIKDNYNTNIDVLKKKHNYKIIFIYRNIYSRNISLFLNWIKIEIKNNWFLDILVKNLEENTYKDFISYIHQKKYIESYKIFIDNLEKIYLKDWHMWPQYLILEKNKISHIEYLINLEKDMEKIELLINEKFKYSNCNNNKEDKNKLLNFLKNNKDYRSKIEYVYKKDINFFNDKFNININYL